MITNYLMGSGILYNKENSNTNIFQKKTMAEEQNPIETLKKLIHEELKECNGKLWPKVCEMNSTEKGKAKLEEMIIRHVAEEGMGIGSSIALIEQELAHIL